MNNQKLITHMKVLAAIDMAPCDKIIDRIKYAANRIYVDDKGREYQFTWKTVSCWYYRFKRSGMTSLTPKKRSDIGTRRKVSLEGVADAINEVLPLLRTNKVGKLLISSVYRMILEKAFFTRMQLSETTFRRIVRENNLLDDESNKKHRRCFSMLHANEMWQVDTMHGPYVTDIDGKKKKTYLIAFIDDASRVITHAEFFFNDNEENLATAFQDALAKRGKPEILYCDNGSNYSAKSIKLACLRLGIKLSHAPIRDGAAKGKCERFFRRLRDQFLTISHELEDLKEFNKLLTQWVENDYNSSYHRGIQMAPIDRFAIDRNRIEYLPEEEYIDEIFFVEESRKMNKDNTFRFDNNLYEAPVYLSSETIQIRYHPKKRNKVLVFFKDRKMGQANFVNRYFNAKTFNNKRDNSRKDDK